MRGSWLGATLLLAACSQRDPTPTPTSVPFQLTAKGCLPAGHPPAPGGSLTVQISASGGAPVGERCELPLDERAVAKIAFVTNPAGAELFVDGGAVSELKLALAPLVADEPVRDLRAWHAKDPAWAAVRERIASRPARTVQARGAGRTDAFEVKVVDFQLNDAAWRALVSASARLPRKPQADATPKAVYLLAASGRTLVAGRVDATLASFDWLATEQEVSRSTVKECHYTDGRSLPLVAVSTKVVVTARDGRTIAEQVLAAPKDVRCDEQTVEVNGKGPDGSINTRYPDTVAWLTDLAQKPPTQP